MYYKEDFYHLYTFFICCHVQDMLAIVATACEVCLSRADDSNMLLCDGCDAGYHTYCTTPQIEEVPEGDWFCIK
jgi:hypothetical protein